MNYEYIIFNIIVFSGPFVLSFDRKVHFYTHWSTFLKALILPAAIFIFWDTQVAGSHWWFNEAFTLHYRIGHLPVGEWLFFFTVPYACLFTWEVFKAYFKNNTVKTGPVYNPYLWGLMINLSALLYFFEMEYTGLALAALSSAVLSDRYLKTYLLKRSLFLWLLALIIFFTLVFNGYLTARPVVLYDYSFQLKLLIGTIPVEDFIYGLALMYHVVVLYEWQQSKKSTRENHRV